MKFENVIPSLPQLKLVGVDNKHPYVFIMPAFIGAGSLPSGHNYRSRVYYGPNVLDMLEAADESIGVTQDKHHIYLESYTVVADRNPGDFDRPGEIELHFGS